MRETTEMWIQERETNREGGKEREGREEHVEYLEERLEFFVPSASVLLQWGLPRFLYEKQERHHLTYLL